MRCVGGCGAFIPQGQVGYFIGGSIHLPVCKACAEKERGGPPPPPPCPVTTLYPGMSVGHFQDSKLLELLDYGYESGGTMRSELCGPDSRGVLWQVRRYAGTLTLGTFEYSSRQDGTKYYLHERRQGSIRQFQSLLDEKRIVRASLRWFPWYSNDTYGLTGPEPLLMEEGMVTPWREAQSIIRLAGGVYWVTASAHGGFMIATHRAAQLLSQAALAIGELFGHWLCYERVSACAAVIYEHREWSHIFRTPDPVGQASTLLQRYYPHYLQAEGLGHGGR